METEDETLESACMKTPGGWNGPGRRASQNPGCGEKVLEHAEYDGADKGDCQIRGHNAQFADERTQEGHLGSLPGLGRCPLTRKIANGSGRIKSALLHYREISAPNRRQRG